MKKTLFVALAVSLLLVYFTGCKKIDEKNLWSEVGDIVDANANDCNKANDEVLKFFDKHAADIDAIIAEIKAKNGYCDKMEHFEDRIKNNDCLLKGKNDPASAIERVEQICRKMKE